MSPNVGNFVHDLVEMAKAMETLPQVQVENERLQKALDTALQTVQDRELSLIGSRDEINLLNAKVRSLEVERDDASFRVLEAEDQAHTTLDRARTIEASIRAMISSLDPPKPEPVKEQEPQQGQSVMDPTVHGTVASSNFLDQPSANNTAIQSENVSTSTAIPEAVHSLEDTTSGQSESSPTAFTAEPSTSSAQNALGLYDPDPTHGPYYNKFYRDIAGYVSYHDWIAGGGTADDYYSRSQY